MKTSVQVLCGPACSGKTRRLLHRFRDLARTAPGAVLWLGPTWRRVDEVRTRLAEGLPACLGPHMLTFQEFADEVVRVNQPSARPLSNVQRRLLLDDIVADLHARGELAHFSRVVDTRGFGHGLFALLAELKRAGIRPIELARAAYRRGYEGRQVGRKRNWHVISAKDRQCARVYASYQSLLRRHGLYDPEGRLWAARELLAAGRRQPFAAVRAVFVDRFSDLTPVQADLLEALCGWVEELWVSLPDEGGDERAELFTRPRTTLERLHRLRPAVEYAVSREREPPAPAGLVHLERQLFRPLRTITPSADATGLQVIEAPGAVGEVRMVARQVKHLLLGGAAAEDILVSLRDLPPYADLVREVFIEYGIPHDVEGAEPLGRNPAVAALLRGLRLPDEDWPFAGVTALLRSGYFRSDWPETQTDPDVAQHAEVLLRLLGEPRGRESYLRAVRVWAEKPQEGLEDEQAEESRRQRTHELAKRCQDFLQRFFRAWDDAPRRATPARHVAWLRHFANDLGFDRAAAEEERDGVALARLWDELDSWVRLDAQIHSGARELEHKVFLRRLGGLAAEAGLARTPRGPGRVRVLSAALARGLAVPHLFVLGLGERSFPRLTPPEPIFEEAERQSFRQAGLNFPGAGDLMPDEMLLFYQLVTRAGHTLTLSYPAVDEKGQALLPSSFLSAVLHCFTPGAVPVERRNMLIEGYDRDAPRCPAEHRVQVAAGLPAPRSLARVLPPDLAANLADAAVMARQRGHENDFSPYEGLFRDPGAVAEVARLFTAEKVLSPTALEGYIACPFQFLLRHVLRLEPLEEPSEGVEPTRRGQAFHRALARLHQELQAAGVHAPAEGVEDRLVERLAEAVEEYAARAPSPASKVLWRLEGRRLQRVAARYRQHWQRFVQPWLEQGVRPQPAHFEVEFGSIGEVGAAAVNPLVVEVDGVEVRLGGRIDRIDVAELPDGVGFWVIDYKTGSPGHYTGKDLQEFRRLQLTLYALAAERVLLTGRGARPLGLLYWLVADATGPKPVLPGTGKQQTAWLDDAERWPAVRAELERWVATLLAHIRGGAFPLKPRAEDCTAACDYGQVCRINQCRTVVEGKAWHLPLPVVR